MTTQKLLTVPEWAKLMGINRRTAFRWAKQGKILTTKVMVEETRVVVDEEYVDKTPRRKKVAIKRRIDA